MQIDIRIAKYLAITYPQISNIHVTEVWKQLILTLFLSEQFWYEFV